ncbi:MAG: hypothetical protein ACE5G9_08940 [Nitrospinales bacterium]
MTSKLDKKYLEIILKPIRICSHYKPKLGRGGKTGYSLSDFQKLYQEDALYSWFGLDNPLMYAAHKAAGGMTSIYRQIGIGCEHLFRQILQDKLDLSPDDTTWSYTIRASGNRTRKLSLDGRIPLACVRNPNVYKRIEKWIKQAAQDLDVAPSVIKTLSGAVFEVRQGYKSKDSKRQNADIANAATAYTKSYLPCVIVLSSQIDMDIVLRYRAEKWLILTGVLGKNNPLISTYDFMSSVIGYDLAGFFERNKKILKREVDSVLKALLTA